MGGITAGELIKYFNMFPKDAELRTLIANPKERVFFEALNISVITDEEVPVLCIEVGNTVAMDEEMVRTCEEDELMSSGIEVLELSTRSHNCLKRARINTIAELCDRTPDQIIRIRDLGRKCLEEIIEKMAQRGLKFKEGE